MLNQIHFHGPIRRYTLISCVACLLFAGSYANAAAKMIKDIGTASDDAFDSFYQDLIVANGIAYFSANDGLNGFELWRSDGTSAGTYMVKNIAPGALSSSPQNFCNVNGTVFFSANNEFWKSDGTEAGTERVTAQIAEKLINVNGLLFFMSFALSNYTGELWKSDGTAAGTTKVLASLAVTEFQEFAASNGKLFFINSDGTNGTELRKSDGTPAGTVLVKDIKAGTTGSNPKMLTDVNGTLFFVADNGSGPELWKSDGSAAGTVLVKNAFTSASTLTAVGSLLYFVANDGVHGDELWKSDGTTAGTVMVKDIYPGSSGSNIPSLVGLNGQVYFAAFDPLYGRELWKSDGTDAGTVIVRDTLPGGTSSWPSNITAFGNKIYFETADSTLTVSTLWSTDGTDAGTMSVATIHSSNGYHPAGTILLFVSTQGGDGRELWKTDGTGAGTSIVRDINAGTSAFRGDIPYHPAIAALGSSVIFAADDGSGAAVWISDGTDAGTLLVNSAGHQPQNFITIGSTVFYQANDIYGTGLWKTDGTPAGTFKLSPSGNNAIPDTAVLNSTLYFVGYDGTSDEYNLWRSDGTVGGTVQISNFISTGNSTSINSLSVAANSLYFWRGSKLWKSDGSTNGTVAIADLSAWEIAESGSTVFVSGYGPGVGGRELWRTDGTTAGTVLIKDIYPGTGSSSPTNLRDFNGKLIFSADDSISGSELWISDGTAAGTVLINDTWPSSQGSYPYHLTTAGNKIYFSATDADHGNELWRSDGTAAGTALVKDISPGAESSAVEELIYVSAKDRIVFSARDPQTGTELWKSDGTELGTERLQDIAPGAGSSLPAQFTIAGSNIFFTANDGLHGRELWVMPLSDLDDPVPALVSLTPDSATYGDGDLTLTVSGTNFSGGTVLLLNGIPVATTVSSHTKLTATIPSSTFHAVGTVTIAAMTPAPGGGTSNSLNFTINKRMPPIQFYPQDIGVGIPIGPAQLNATASTAGTFTYTPPAGTVFDTAQNELLTVQFVPADTTNFQIPPPYSSLLTVVAYPQILSGPSISPSAAVVTEPISFAVQSDQPGVDIQWNFGDGNSAAGANATHSYIPAGKYTVSVTITNHVGLSASTSFAVDVLPLGSGGPADQIDSDGDGFSDELEIAAGSSPSNFDITPFQLEPGAATQNLMVSKCSLSLNFATRAADRMAVSGELPVRKGFDAANQLIFVDVGGVVRTFQLDRKGRSREFNQQFLLKFNSRTAKLSAQNAKFQIKIGPGAFASFLSDEGFTQNAGSKPVAREVLVTLLFDGMQFQKRQQQHYSVRSGRIGFSK